MRLRTIKTRTGHTIQFVEEDKGSSKAGIRLQTTKGHKIYLNDSEACIEIETKGGHKVKMDDQGQSISNPIPYKVLIKASVIHIR